MNVLIIFAHPKNKGSFNHAILKEFTRGLEAAGHSFEIVDLYRIGFDPVFRERDYVFFADPDIPSDILEKMGWKKRILEASGKGPFGYIKKYIARRWLQSKTLPEIIREIGKHKPKDVLEQQQKVAWADGLVLISPVIWMHYPAILKGWLERVFSYRFAYSLKPEGWEGSSKGRIPLLKLKKALSINTTFFTEKDYKSKGFLDAMKKIIIDWSLKYPGIPEADLVYFYAVSAVSDEKRNEYLQEAFSLGREY